MPATRKSAERRFRSSPEDDARLAEELLAVFEHAPSGVALVHADGRFVRVNPALGVMLGRPAGVLAQMSWQEVVHPGDRAAVEAAVKRAVAGEGVEVEVRALRPDGAEVHLRVTARALPGESPQIVAHCEDRTARLAHQATLEAVVDAAAEAIIGIDDRDLVRIFSPSAVKMFGWTAEDIVGRSVWTLVGAGREEQARELRAALVAGRTVHREGLMPRRDGSMVEVFVTAGPIIGADGSYRGAALTVLDVSARRRAEADRARLGALAEAAPDAIVITDSEGTIANWNPGAEQTFGLAPDEAVGRSYEETVVPDEDRHTYRRVRRDLEYGRARTVRMGARRADGSVFPAQVSAAALHDGAGTVVIVRDISDLVAAQRELERSNAELERFAIAASHDLQEPLRTIRMGAETVMHAASERLDDDERDLLAHVEQAADRMSSQVTALMNVARVALEDGPEEVTPLQRALDDALLALEAAVRESDAHIDVAGRLPVVAVPRAEMALILQNLLSNAIKFRRAGERPSVVLRAREANGVVELRVADNGIGLTEAAAAKIFGLFERDRTGVPGTGVGLAVCRQILDRRGGSISVSSGGPGQGAAFTLRLRSA